MHRAAWRAAGTAAAAALGWALFEAQWVELREVEVPIAGLPPELDGFRILQLSDFHLGTRSFNGRALDLAVDWAVEDGLDVVAVTGDLLSRRRGEDRLRRALGRLRPRHGTFAVLGNHDLAVTRDPFVEPTDAEAISRSGAVLLRHEAATFEAGQRTVQVVGSDPFRWMAEPPDRLVDESADLRILLAHFPDVAEWLRPGSFQLALAGHLHGGQICIPSPWGKVRLEHVRTRYREGLYNTPAGMLYVSRGLGTSFVPLRFLARPEATKLVLRSV